MIRGNADVVLRISPAVAWDDARLAASSGIVPGREARPAQGYASGAWVPRQPWQPVDSRSLQQGRGTQPDRSRSIGLVAISGVLLEQLRTEADLSPSPGSLAHFVGALCGGLTAEWHVARAPEGLSLGRNPAGLPTVTKDPKSGKFVGMHVDTFHEDYGPSRSVAGNRISVNIGTGPRYLLFVPCSYAQLFRRAGSPAGRADVVATFLAENVDQPVLRLRVDPGEAYIAPTESIVHDASSLTCTGDDLHVTGRGIFDPRPC